MESLTLQPIARVDGTINLPGSKSVSNRALLLAALAHGKTVLTNLLDSDDVRHMLNALTALGVSYTLSADRTRCEIIGNGGPLHAKSALELFLGNAGTAMRPLAAALCLGSNDIVLTGEPRMKERPIGHLVDALRLGGAKITYLEQENYPPLRLQGGFTGGNVDVDGSVSSQFLTALLMTAPLAPEDTVIRIKGDLVSKPYIDITLNLMKTFGVEIENQHYQQFVVKGGQSYQSPGRVEFYSNFLIKMIGISEFTKDMTAKCKHYQKNVCDDDYCYGFSGGFFHSFSYWVRNKSLNSLCPGTHAFSYMLVKWFLTVCSEIPSM